MQTRDGEAFRCEDGGGVYPPLIGKLGRRSPITWLPHGEAANLIEARTMRKDGTAHEVLKSICLGRPSTEE
jgi:hypothetical protein